jgi:NAD(P)-dependent dehydrogenase (short-subunit alcohol dehydrogenase family)
LIRFTTAVSDFADRYGVRVSCIVPHWIGLPRAVAEYERMSIEEQRRRSGLIDPDVVADAVTDLASDPDCAGRVIVVRAGRPPYAIDPANSDPFR